MRNLKSFFSLSALVVGLSLLAPLHASAFDEDNQFWGQFITMGRPIKDQPFGVFFEYQGRVSDRQDRLYESFIRPALYYQLNDKVSLWAGYLSLRRDDFDEIEQRPWQQLNYSEKIEGWSLLLRLRQEQRLFEFPVRAGADTSAILHRTRVMLRANAPIVSEGEWYAFLPLIQNELFFNLNDHDRGVAGYQQNRAFLGFSKWLDEKWLVDAGYLNVHQKRVNREDAMLHALFLTLWHRW